MRWFFQDYFWRLSVLETKLNNQESDYHGKILSLRWRVYSLEKHLKLSNTFHHAEINEPNFEQFETWALKKDTAIQAIKRDMRRKNPSTENEQ
jgi:hypothetical protein